MVVAASVFHLSWSFFSVKPLRRGGNILKIKGYKLFIGYVLARYAQCDGQVITGGNISIAQVCVSFWLTAAALVLLVGG
jgi:hypothetical protein